MCDVGVGTVVAVKGGEVIPVDGVVVGGQSRRSRAAALPRVDPEQGRRENEWEGEGRLGCWGGGSHSLVVGVKEILKGRWVQKNRM
jgi:hypothetical protein